MILRPAKRLKLRRGFAHEFGLVESVRRRHSPCVRTCSGSSGFGMRGMKPVLVVELCVHTKQLCNAIGRLAAPSAVLILILLYPRWVVGSKSL